jgi:hypothetical protein
MTLLTSIISESQSSLVAQLDGYISNMTEYDFDNANDYDEHDVREDLNILIDSEGEIKIGHCGFSRSRILSEMDPTAYWSMFNDHVDAYYIQHGSNYYLKDDLANLKIDVRLELFNARFTLHFGDACYDTSHKGIWASTTIDSDSDAEEIFSDLVDQLIN